MSKHEKIKKIHLQWHILLTMQIHPFLNGTHFKPPYVETLQIRILYGIITPRGKKIAGYI